MNVRILLIVPEWPSLAPYFICLVIFFRLNNNIINRNI